MMFSDHSIDMNISGQSIDHNHPIMLDPYKANMIPYFHDACLPVDYAFYNIEDNLLLAKDDQGLYYIPDQNINTLETLCPGNAYIIFLQGDTAIEFTYPDMIASRYINDGQTNNENTDVMLAHGIYKTGISKPIIINEIAGEYSEGDHIVVYANEIPVGAAAISGEFPIVVSAWSSFETDNLTLPGYSDGDIINLTLYRTHFDIYIDLETDFNVSSFGSELIITGTTSHNDENIVEINDFKLNNVYPNPFNPITNISLDVFKAGEYTINIYNLLGQAIYTDITSYAKPGNYNIKLDGTNFASGTYILVIGNSKQQSSKKITLLK